MYVCPESMKKEMQNINLFFNRQINDWPLLNKNYAGLRSVLEKEFHFDGFEIKLQFNPERIRSAVAKKEEIRPCFLCKENRPKEQETISILSYSILANPYPIFPGHLTIPDQRHLPQLIANRVENLLDLTKNLSGFSLLYNGPQSGASVPDHFHFQAVQKGFLPLERDILSFPGKKLLWEDSLGRIYRMDDYLRKCLIYESKEKEWLLQQFEQLTKQLPLSHPTEEEPQWNLVSLYEQDRWHLVVFPRKQHRPAQFYEEGEKQILISPGVVDFAGVLISVRKEDFDKMNPDLIRDIYSQLTLSDEDYVHLLSHYAEDKAVSSKHASQQTTGNHF
jgi:hypothetical protein